MTKLSLVIPIYNVEDYLVECLESINNSKEKLNGKGEIRVLLINDGSSDKSGEIAKEYAEKFDYEYYEKANGGLSDARNYGLRFVNTDYVAFLDSDDKVTPNYFLEVFNGINENPDLIVFDWLDYFYDNSTRKVKGIENQDDLWSVQPSAWNKIYRTELFNDIKYPVGKIYEDVGTTYKLISKIKKYKYLDSALIYYRKGRKNSILTTISPKINDIYSVLDDTYKYYYPEIKENKMLSKGLCYQYIKLLLWSNMYRQLKYYKYNFWGFHKKMKETRDIIYKSFPDWKKCELLRENKLYFVERLGTDYIRKLDSIGKSPFHTLNTMIYVVLKNIKRK
ncbi:glycosyltransferase family 2 protein [Gottfriedia sp. NPDC057948]|uniref:glycosyltransferase family 2 protein n=1 Tax=Gottfriedia sp. NPDC057948 TaxID=3346287 RepID=UPI0036DF66F3